jgi:hypothetical protein
MPLSKSIIFLILVSLISALLLPGCGKSHIEKGYLPWQVSLNASGQVEVFEVTLGKTTLEEAVNQWHAEAKVALFESPEGGLSLEGYFGRIKLGAFSAHLVARLTVPPDLMKAFVAGRVKPAPMPSGVKRYKLKSQHLRQAYKLVVAELTYIPLIASDDEWLRQRFGEPSERQRLAEGRGLWVYPDKGVLIILDEDDKEVFQYFNPEDYRRVHERLKAGQKNTALVGG